MFERVQRSQLVAHTSTPHARTKQKCQNSSARLMHDSSMNKQAYISRRTLYSNGQFHHRCRLCSQIFESCPFLRFHSTPISFPSLGTMLSVKCGTFFQAVFALRALEMFSVRWRTSVLQYFYAFRRAPSDKLTDDAKYYEVNRNNKYVWNFAVVQTQP